jgi:catechol 2,3-dioxygenase-like lactoylglutathione lyase family enzyme
MLKIEGINHATSPITDVEKAKEFYGKVLGLKELPRPEIPGVRGAFFACGGGEIHLGEKDSEYMRKNIPINLMPHVAFTVKSVEQVKRTLTEAGIPYFEFARSPVGRNQIFVQDPDGNVLEITDYRPGHAG